MYIISIDPKRLGDKCRVVVDDQTMTIHYTTPIPLGGELVLTTTLDPTTSRLLLDLHCSESEQDRRSFEIYVAFYATSQQTFSTKAIAATIMMAAGLFEQSEKLLDALVKLET